MADTNRHSNIYIKDPSTGTKYYLDCEPLRYPVVRGNREYDYFTWEHTYMDPTTAEALWTLCSTHRDVNIDIDDGKGERLCRWDDGEGFYQVKGDGKKSRTYSVNVWLLDSRATSVQISDYNGANTVTLDYEPYPFPEPMQNLDGTLEINLKSRYITRAKANSLKSLFPNDIQVKLTSSGYTWYCRWDSGGLTIDQSNRDILSLSVKATALYYIGQPRTGKIFIYDHVPTSGTAVQLYNNPHPFPIIQRERAVISQRCLPGGTDTIEPGEMIHADLGTHISDGVFSFSTPYLSSANITTLMGWFNNMNDNHFSLDGGVTKYKAVMSECQPVGYGYPSQGCSFKFKIIEQV